MLLLCVCSPCRSCTCMQTPETFPWERLGEVMPMLHAHPQVHVQLCKRVLEMSHPPTPSILTAVLLICSSRHLIGCLRHPGNHLTKQFFFFLTQRRPRVLCGLECVRCGLNVFYPRSGGFVLRLQAMWYKSCSPPKLCTSPSQGHGSGHIGAGPLNTSFGHNHVL